MLKNLLKDPSRLDWFDGDNVRPYVYVRSENRVHLPGSLFSLDWFKDKPVYMDPLRMENLEFGNLILELEAKAFEKSDMAMPRWVFYDCAVMPGFVAGFAHRRKTLPPELKSALAGNTGQEWVPISLFIVIPAMAAEWTAHNLSSANFLLPRQKQFYGLGFLTKAFGLWYANIGICCGMTQWQSPAIRLHSHYGQFEILTAYTPLHSYARTLTYRLKVDPDYWPLFFTQGEPESFAGGFESAGFKVEPAKDKSLVGLQTRIEQGEGPYFLSPHEIRHQRLDEPLNVYRPAKA